jgi:hypothetical protein
MIRDIFKIESDQFGLFVCFCHTPKATKMMLFMVLPMKKNVAFVLAQSTTASTRNLKSDSTFLNLDLFFVELMSSLAPTGT